MKPLLAHSAVEHAGEAVEYGAFATPLSYEAEKKAKYGASIKEVVEANRIWREHGSGWYFYALHYGVGEALSHIRQLEEQDVGAETLRDRVRKRGRGGLL